MNSNGLWLRSIKNRIHSVQCLSCTNWRNKREPLKRKIIWKISYFITKHNFFKNSFFPLVINEWNKLDTSLRRYASQNVFKSNILKLMQPSSNSLFYCHNLIRIKYITRIRLELSHLHKFKHNFQDTLNPICDCGNDVESAIHFFLHCPLYNKERHPLLSSLANIDHTLLDNTDFLLTQILMFGNITFNAKENTKNNQLGH